MTGAEGSAAVAYPDAPWHLVGSMWLTVFRLGHDVDRLRPRGVYGAAFVSYEEGSPLTYAELVVARLLRRGEGHGRRVTITDIWVDSPASRAGGRELWAIPKDLAEFDLVTARRGPVATADWSATTGRRPVASASFRSPAWAAPRTPMRGGTWQPVLPEGHGPHTAPIRGTARTLPARARWQVAVDGPLGFLRGARQLASLRLADFRLTFG